MSSITEPVRVCVGYQYEPVRQYAVQPSSLNAFVLATRLATLRVVPSVPSRPTTVVTPASTSWDSFSGGTWLEKPPSPPPPVICTCWSI